MASYTISAGQVALHEKTLNAGEEDVVTISGDRAEVEVVKLTSGSGERIYFSADDAVSAATVRGQDCRVVVGGEGASRRVEIRGSGDAVVRLITEQAGVVYSIECSEG